MCGEERERDHRLDYCFCSTHSQKSERFIQLQKKLKRKLSSVNIVKQNERNKSRCIYVSHAKQTVTVHTTKISLGCLNGPISFRWFCAIREKKNPKSSAKFRKIDFVLQLILIQ